MTSKDILILSLSLALIASLYRCCKVENAQKETTVEYRYDTTIKTVTIEKIKPVTETLYLPSDVIHDTFYKEGKIDSLGVVLAYYTARYYERNYSDSNIAINFRDSVYKNELAYTSFDYRLLRPTAIITNVSKVEVRNHIYIGLGLSQGLTGVFPSVGPELLFIGKDKLAYRLSYQFGQNSGILGTSVYYKIGK